MGLKPNTFCVLLPVLFALATSGCAATFERQNTADLSHANRTLAPARTPDDNEGPQVTFSGDLQDYLGYALENNQALRASFEEWRAASHLVSPARKLPEPVFTYGLFIQRVETRVGPQRHRFSVSQNFPWPTQLTSAADAASYAARSAQRRFEARRLMIARRVVVAYWSKWTLARMRSVISDQMQIVRYMAGAARARLEVGKAGLAAVGQVDLQLSRLADRLAGLDESAHQASAELIAACAAPLGTLTPIAATQPPIVTPAESPDALRDAVKAHPLIDAISLMASSKQELARSADLAGLPSFGIKLTFIETGESPMPDVQDSGKDPLLVSLSVKLPLWRSAYNGKEEAALAQSAALRAKRSYQIDEALAALDKTLARLRDASRRVQLYQTTLVPQAETVFQAVLGEYASGGSDVASELLAQRALLDLQLGLFKAQAQHAAAWADLEQLVGRPVKSRRSGGPDVLPKVPAAQ